jgi:putative ABC transport system ATP-binding protein
VADNPIIEVSGLTKVYKMGGVEVPALRGVDLTVYPGEFLAILGPSGSGKSTLFHVIGGLTPPTTGVVKIDGQDLSAVSDRERTNLRKHTVGFVFQRFNLLPTLTARENIEIAKHIGGNTAKNDPEFERILDILGIEKRLDHKPYALSGGEQQRVAIARAMVNHPRLLLADEPTGNLDTANSQAVLETLKSVCQRTGQTILMITHNPEAAAFCAGRVLRMTDGHIVEE